MIVPVVGDVPHLCRDGRPALCRRDPDHQGGCIVLIEIKT